MPIYFIKVINEPFVKIGYAAFVNSRFTALQALNHKKLKIIRVVQAHRRAEIWFHNYFAKLRIRGKWFKYCREMRTVMPPNNVGGGVRSHIHWPPEIIVWIDRERKSSHRTRAAEFIHQILRLAEKND